MEIYRVWLDRPMPDLVLASTGLREMATVCASLYMEEDNNRTMIAVGECGELLKEHPKINNERDKYLFVIRCISVKFGVVDDATGVVDKQRLGQLVSESTDVFDDDDEKEEFQIEVVDTCHYWECLTKYCRMSVA